MSAEAWLLNEKIYIDRCEGTGDRWLTVKQREKQSRPVQFIEYGAKVIAQRDVKETSRQLYEDKWSKLIAPAFEHVAVKDMSTQAVRDWFSSLDKRYATRNAHAYTVVSMVCATAVEDGLLVANPCKIKGATSVKAKPKGEPLTAAEVFAMAQWLYDYTPSNRKGYKPGTIEYPYRQYKYLILMSAFCGGTRIGETIELRRKDIVLSRGVPKVLRVERQVTHRLGECQPGTTKTEDQRAVDIPSLIHAEVLELLKTIPNDPEALLFSPIQGGTWDCNHLNPNSFNTNILKRAAREALGREDVSPHSLRHFANTVANHAGLPLKEAMARTGHRSKQIHLDYIDGSTRNGAAMAERISDNVIAESNQASVQTREKTA
ncbi:hypothetical protein A5742_21325 [Mycolicibacterium fortuitum]|uniref:Tyr recombinase domain-containing protein n=2 Tax=Mycolicibacterium fortuitum TaxID=1766 RepID=A0ABD6QRT2_MYCFO|nr:hypothetical protein A5742_21325 [Mycolicibacterium fortuitum]